MLCGAPDASIKRRPEPDGRPRCGPSVWIEELPQPTLTSRVSHWGNMGRTTHEGNNIAVNWLIEPAYSYCKIELN